MLSFMLLCWSQQNLRNIQELIVICQRNIAEPACLCLVCVLSMSCLCLRNELELLLRAVKCNIVQHSAT